MATRTLAALLAAAATASPALAQSLVRPPHVTEELLCERSPKKARGMALGGPVIGLAGGDLTKVAWLALDEKPWHVMVNGQPLAPPSDDQEVVLSPDGQHVLRAGKVLRKWFVWKDGEQFAGPFDRVEGLRYSADGRPVFAAKRAKAWTWIVDDEELPVTTPDVGPIAVAGNHTAFATKRLDGWRMVVDGEVGPAFDRIGRIVFSPDGSRLAYAGLRKGRMVAVVDGKEEQVQIGVDGFRFSPDSKRVAYVALDASKEAAGLLVIDGTPSRPYPALIENGEGDFRAAHTSLYLGTWTAPALLPYLTGVSAPAFGPDGKVVYAARTARPPGGQVLLRGGGLEMVPGIARNKGQEGIWVEGADKPLFEASLVLDGPVLSEEGGHVGWVEWDATESRWIGFIDGRAVASVPSTPKRSNESRKVTISRDGSRLAFVHLAGGEGFLIGRSIHALQRVVASGVEDKAYDAIEIGNLRFSEDGKHLAYEVRSAKGIDVEGAWYADFVVIDGVPGRAYSDVLYDTMRFTAPDAVTYVARLQEVKDGPYKYYRVTQTAP